MGVLAQYGCLRIIRVDAAHRWWLRRHPPHPLCKVLWVPRKALYKCNELLLLLWMFSFSCKSKWECKKKQSILIHRYRSSPNYHDFCFWEPWKCEKCPLMIIMITGQIWSALDAKLFCFLSSSSPNNREWWSMKQMSLWQAHKTRSGVTLGILTQVLPWRGGGVCLLCCADPKLLQ